MSPRLVFVLQLLLLAIPVVAALVVVAIGRKKRRFAYFRVRGEDGKALVGGVVSTVHVRGRRELLRAVGRLDERGCFQQMFAPFGLETLIVKGPGIETGELSLREVSDYLQFPDEPYECVVAQGVLRGPTSPAAP